MIDKFVNSALAMMGTPFHHQGMWPGLGLDCIGLVVCAAQEAGVALPLIAEDEKGYKKTVNHPLFMRAMMRRFVRKHSDPMVFERGDILVFWKKKQGRAQHCGIVVDDTFMVNCADETGVALARYHGFWADRLVAVFELPR